MERVQKQGPGRAPANRGRGRQGQCLGGPRRGPLALGGRPGPARPRPRGDTDPASWARPPPLPGPPPPPGQQPVAASFLEEKELAPNGSELVSSSAPGARSSPPELCLGFLICHMRTGVLPPCLSRGRCRAERSRRARTVGSVPAGLPSGWSALPSRASWRTEDRTCCFRNAQQWRGAGSDPQKGGPALGACPPEKQRPPSTGTGTSQKWEPTSSRVGKSRKEGGLSRLRARSALSVLPTMPAAL